MKCGSLWSSKGSPGWYIRSGRRLHLKALKCKAVLLHKQGLHPTAVQDRHFWIDDVCYVGFDIFAINLQCIAMMQSQVISGRV